MARHNPNEIARLTTALARLEAAEFPLPGIRNPAQRLVYVKQVIDSIRRVNYVSVVASRNLDPRRADPQSDLFDPIKAALINMANGNIDEAFWLVFLFVHFGKHRRSGWRYASEVYGRLRQGPDNWTWIEISADPTQFRDWLRANQATLTRGTNRGFGNHRKYQSMDSDKPTGTGMAVESYVNWVMAYGGHAQLIRHALAQSQGNSQRAFDWLYGAMNAVVSFGRTAKFDYLTMLGKLGLARIEPGSAYLAGATGPVSGARLMLQGSVANELSLEVIDSRLVTLSQYLGVGMQVIEDSLCNWQKSPSAYKLFSG